jgi:intracellular sulfur oxidation DsrE/DsrF family protein
MSMDNNYSDEKLQLFVDDEMNSSDRAEFMEAISNDDELSNRVCEIIQLKDALRLAYSEPPKSVHGTSPRDAAFQGRGWLNAAAAVLLLAAGTLGGWTLYPQFGASNEATNIAAVDQTQSENIILHISKSDPEQFTAALDYAGKFLTEHEAQGHQVDVVAHAGGLDMMRADASPIKEQIVAMMDKYDNVHFVACAGAIKMYTQKNGVAPVIIQGVGTDYTAFDHIVGRLQGGGWKYFKFESLSEK